MDKGEFNLVFQIPQIFYSTLISSSINYLIRYLSLSEKNIIDFKNDIGLMNKTIQTISIKFIFFLLLVMHFYYFFGIIYHDFI